MSAKSNRASPLAAEASGASSAASPASRSANDSVCAGSPVGSPISSDARSSVRGSLAAGSRMRKYESGASPELRNSSSEPCTCPSVTAKGAASPLSGASPGVPSEISNGTSA